VVESRILPGAEAVTIGEMHGPHGAVRRVPAALLFRDHEVLPAVAIPVQRAKFMVLPVSAAPACHLPAAARVQVQYPLFTLLAQEIGKSVAVGVDHDGMVDIRAAIGRNDEIVTRSEQDTA